MKAYGTLDLTNASPAQIFVEPLTLAQAKAFLRITDTSPADAEQDAMLSGFIMAARETAEILQGRDLIAKQYDLSLDLMLGHDSLSNSGCLDQSRAIYDLGTGYGIELRQPLQSVDLFRYRDSSGSFTPLTEGTDYIVDLARGIVMPPYNQSWPSFDHWPTSAILIRFTAGYPSTHPFWLDAGQRLIVGMKMLIEMWFDERLPFVQGAVQELPFAVSALLGFGARNRVY